MSPNPKIFCHWQNNITATGWIRDVLYSYKPVTKTTTADWLSNVKPFSPCNGSALLRFIDVWCLLCFMDGAAVQSNCDKFQLIKTSIKCSGEKRYNYFYVWCFCFVLSFFFCCSYFLHIRPSSVYAETKQNNKKRVCADGHTCVNGALLLAIDVVVVVQRVQCRVVVCKVVHRTLVDLNDRRPFEHTDRQRWWLR